MKSVYTFLRKINDCRQVPRKAETRLGQKVEVLVFTYDEPSNTPKATPDVMAQFWGVVSEQTTEAMHKHVALSRD